MRRGVSASVLVALTALAVGCETVRVRTDYDHTIDFANLRTYAWLDPPLREAPREEGGRGGDPFTENTLIDRRVRDEVDAWLTNRGFRRAAEGEQPDFFVRYELVSRDVPRDSPVFVSTGFGRFGSGFGYGSGVGYSGSTTYQEGTLILDVIDPATEQIAWRGWGTSQARDLQMTPERLRNSVSAVLERFPPKSKRSPAEGAAD